MVLVDAAKGCATEPPNLSKYPVCWKFICKKLLTLDVVIPQFDWLCNVCGCVMSPTSGIYWVDLGFINNYKEP